MKLSLYFSIAAHALFHDSYRTTMEMLTFLLKAETWTCGVTKLYEHSPDFETHPKMSYARSLLTPMVRPLVVVKLALFSLVYSVAVDLL